MKTVFSWFKVRPLRFIGGFLVFFSLGLLVFLVLLDMVAGASNPYIGVVTYMLLPIVLMFGLVLVPVDAWIQRRRQARGEPAPIALDLTNPTVRNVATFFAGSSMLILIALTVVSYRGVEYMDTKDFCGRVCHKVMMPEYTAYTRSPHASVPCIQCHIGPGASWFVRSKLSGIPQVWHYTLADYPRPLQTPVETLRPSRDTCENCHDPRRFYGDRSLTTITYKGDELNSKIERTMMMHTGNGGSAGSGIHGHMVKYITYLPAKKDRTEIAWVKVVRPDGSEQEFVNPDYKADIPKLRAKYETRRMDCIDCHNRAAHDFVSYQDLLDNAISSGDVDSSIPFIKKQLMDIACPGVEVPKDPNATDEPKIKVPTEAEQKTMAGKIDALTAFYEKTYPDLYKKRAADIQKSVSFAKSLFLTADWPHMRVNSQTYTNWKSHKGCWRCHGQLQAAKPGGKRDDVPMDCTLCHTEQVSTPKE